MRRFLLGGLGIALGAFASPALAQQPTSNPPARGAAFGRPTAVGDVAPDSGVTPVGLIRGGPPRPVTVQSPVGGGFGAPTPVISAPPGQPIPTMNPPGVPGSPRPVSGAPPMITEMRDPTGRIPGGAVVVPSVVPDAGFECPDPGLDEPLFDGRPRAGLGRLAGLGGGKTWVSAELLLWWNKGTQVPALVTTSSPQFNGIPGTGDTQVLLGGPFGESFHVGGRIGVGHWFGDGECRGVDARLFWVAPSTATFGASVPPFALLARPFININPTVTTPNVPVGQTAEVVAGPGVANGSVTAAMRSTVWGAEVNYRRFLAGNGMARVDGLVGYRYLDVSEDLTITEMFARVPGSDPNIGIPAVAGVITDRFRTDNRFHGGQIGAIGTINRGRWSLEGRGTVAFGTVFQSATISGAQTLTMDNGMVTSVPGGLLAVPGANIGTFSQTRFAVVPEVGLNLGYQVTDRMKVFVGYNFLYLSSAVRPGEVIDQRIDAARVPNLLPADTAGTPVLPARPMPLLSTSGYFVQGINFGLVFKW